MFPIRNRISRMIDCEVDFELLALPPSTYSDEFSGDHSSEVPPDPIPNSEVKLASADGTARVTMWESRTSPEIHYEGS